VHEPVPPSLGDHLTRRVAADSEVDVLPVPGLVPLSSPQVRQRLATETVAQVTEEGGDVLAQLRRVVAAGPR
jgi:hypothetical protein